MKAMTPLSVEVVGSANCAILRGRIVLAKAPRAMQDVLRHVVARSNAAPEMFNLLERIVAVADKFQAEHRVEKLTPEISEARALLARVRGTL